MKKRIRGLITGAKTIFDEISCGIRMSGQLNQERGNRPTTPTTSRSVLLRTGLALGPGWTGKESMVSPERLLDSAKLIIESLVSKHMDRLIEKRRAVLSAGGGLTDSARWSQDCADFLNVTVKPYLSKAQLRALGPKISEVAMELIEGPVRKRMQRQGYLIDAPSRATVGRNRARPQERNFMENAAQANCPAGRRQGVFRSGLIIRPEPLSQILAGLKTWEMRSTPTTKRERIALIEKGTKRILGVATISGCRGPLTHEEMIANFRYHRISEARLRDPEISKWRTAWVLEDIVALQRPVFCTIRPGAVIFVNLDEVTAAQIRRAI